MAKKKKADNTTMTVKIDRAILKLAREKNSKLHADVKDFIYEQSKGNTNDY